MEFNARITRIQQKTPTVKSFQLAIEVSGFTFLAGQWIDLYIERPGEEPVIGGFTLASSPARSDRIELAIKGASGGRAARYMHDHAVVGDEFFVVGPSGDFYFREGMADSIVLIAGGIGINPLMSMVRYVDDTHLDVQMTLIHSAKMPSELLFRNNLQEIQRRNPLLRCYFTVTRPDDESWRGRVGRIGKALLREALPDADSLFYLCGPRGMPTYIAGLLTEIGVKEEAILFEEW